MLEKLRGRCPRLVKIWADKAYHSLELIAWAEAQLGVALAVVGKPAGQKGFSPLPKRWTVERTFGWFGKYRRLSKDYEQNPASSEAYLYLAMTHLMVRRLSR